jgi:hypothetical protein
MGLYDFESEENKDAYFTLPNAISVARGVGGLAVGVGLAMGNISPEEALVATAVLGASDAEGISIELTKRFPRLQRALRILPSKVGRFIDPIMDKLFAVSVFIGGMFAGYIPLEQGLPILATEAGTAIVTGIATERDGEAPVVSEVGTWGMVARIGSMVLNFAASAETGSAQEVLAAGGIAFTAGAVILGTMSAINIYRGDQEQPNNI